MTTREFEDWTIHNVPREIAVQPHDGSCAYSHLPPEYQGPCAMCIDGSRGADWILFPSVEEGEKAAAAAINPTIGGYGGVYLHLPGIAPSTAWSCQDAAEWLLGNDPRPKPSVLDDPRYRRVFVRTVGELKQSLQNLPDDMPIIHAGYPINGFPANRKGAMVSTAGHWLFSDIEAGVRQERGGWALRVSAVDGFDWRAIAGREPEQGE